jgi:hypothetical protein
MDERVAAGGGSEPVEPTAASAAGTPPVDPWATFDRWTSWFCLGLAVLAGIVGLLAIGPASQDLHPILVVATLAFLVAEAALLYAVSAGLSRGRPWARRAAMWVLWLAMITGFGGALVDIAQSKITIPIAAIVAAVILVRAPRPLPSVAAGDARRATALGVAFLVLLVLPVALGYIATGAASPLVASADDLAMALDVVCAGDGTAMPERIDVRTSWTWRDRDAFPGRPDTVAIGWSSSDARLSDYTLDDHGASSSTLVPGADGLSGSAVDAALSGGDYWSWSVGDVGQVAEDGSVTVSLIPRHEDPAQRPADGSVQLHAIYAHLDRWTVRQEGVCRWGAEATAP